MTQCFTLTLYCPVNKELSWVVFCLVKSSIKSSLQNPCEQIKSKSESNKKIMSNNHALY